MADNDKKNQHGWDESLITGEHSYKSIEDSIDSVVLDQSRHQRQWQMVVGLGFLGVNMLLVAVTCLLYTGIGIWGNNQPVAWAFDIINFVWWIGIGHAGTLISAILLLMRQQW
ncbi:MAG TPA: hypothetical protein PLX06_13415, partial [Fimbriimonadaceae bacterium]|nr:hypothetical protein [Fimbriimonadaceae bacterium]